MKIDIDEIVSHMLERRRGGQPHEEDFRAFAKLAISNPLFLDIGANSGQSAISFSMVKNDAIIVSLEPNRLFEPVFDALQLQGVFSQDQFRLHVVGAGNCTKEVTLFVPVVDGTPYFQEATTDTSQFEKSWSHDRLQSYGEDLRFEQMTISIIPVDELGLEPHVVKIDAEGGELMALHGMQDTIEKCHPIFLIENNDWDSVTPYLAGYGYGCYMYEVASDRLVPLIGDVCNCFYLLPEHAAVLLNFSPGQQ